MYSKFLLFHWYSCFLSFILMLKRYRSANETWKKYWMFNHVIVDLSKIRSSWMIVQNNKTNKKRKTKPNKGEYKVISIAFVQPKNCITSVVRCMDYQVSWLVLLHSHGKRYIKIIVIKIYWVYWVSTYPYYLTIDCLFLREDKSLFPVCIYHWSIRSKGKLHTHVHTHGSG